MFRTTAEQIVTWDGGSHQVVACEDGWAYVDVSDGSDLDVAEADRVLAKYGFELMDLSECEPDFLGNTTRYWAAIIDGGSND